MVVCHGSTTVPDIYGQAYEYADGQIPGLIGSSLRLGFLLPPALLPSLKAVNAPLERRELTGRSQDFSWMLFAFEYDSATNVSR